MNARHVSDLYGGLVRDDFTLPEEPRREPCALLEEDGVVRGIRQDPPAKARP